MSWSDALNTLANKLPVKWIVIFVGFSLVSYFGLQFYTEHNRVKLEYARLSQPSKAPEVNTKRVKAGFIINDKEKQSAKGSE